MGSFYIGYLMAVPKGGKLRLPTKKELRDGARTFLLEKEYSDPIGIPPEAIEGAAAGLLQSAKNVKEGLADQRADCGVIEGMHFRYLMTGGMSSGDEDDIWRDVSDLIVSGLDTKMGFVGIP